jgi:hypothetical protein
LLLSVHRTQLVEHQRLIVVQPAYDCGQHLDVVSQDANFGQNALELRGDELKRDWTLF